MKFLLFYFFSSSFFVSTQNISIYIDSYISISDNSSIYVDGLGFAPSSTFSISGPNSLDRSSSPIVVGDNSSINRVYSTTSELEAYSGIVIFRYEDSELNGISELDLVLEVQDGSGQWTNLTPIIDEVNNTLTYDFSEFVNFTTVTASSVSSILSVDPVEVNEYVKVYPNPATNYIFIVSNSPQKATLFNTTGQKILETSAATELDVIDLPSGVYLLNLQNTQNQISTFKIIKK